VTYPAAVARWWTPSSTCGGPTWCCCPAISWPGSRGRCPTTASPRCGTPSTRPWPRPCARPASPTRPRWATTTPRRGATPAAGTPSPASATPRPRTGPPPPPGGARDRRRRALPLRLVVPPGAALRRRRRRLGSRHRRGRARLPARHALLGAGHRRRAALGDGPPAAGRHRGGPRPGGRGPVARLRPARPHAGRRRRQLRERPPGGLLRRTLGRSGAAVLRRDRRAVRGSDARGGEAHARSTVSVVDVAFARCGCASRPSTPPRAVPRRPPTCPPRSTATAAP
jgi:hypothetical protein